MRLSHRIAAALCYVGALRVPVVALVVPEWAFTIPTGLALTALVWLYGRRRSPFLLHHAREALGWSLQANLVLAGLSVVSMLLHALGSRYGIGGALFAWHLMAVVFRWAGLLLSIVTLLMMSQALRGRSDDPFDFARKA